jgi:hypothetical protein
MFFYLRKTLSAGPKTPKTIRLLLDCCIIVFFRHIHWAGRNIHYHFIAEINNSLDFKSVKCFTLERFPHKRRLIAFFVICYTLNSKHC